jgi:hypothetical protein
MLINPLLSHFSKVFSMERNAKSKEYKLLKPFYDAIVIKTGGVFSIVDYEEHYCLKRAEPPLQVDLPESLSAGSMCRVYLMSNPDEKRLDRRPPKVLHNELKELIERADKLELMGYTGEFAIADDCFEYRYNLPVHDESGLVRILNDFSSF